MIIILKSGERVHFTYATDADIDKMCREVKRSDKGFITFRDDDTDKITTIIRTSEIDYVGPYRGEETK